MARWRGEGEAGRGKCYPVVGLVAVRPSEEGDPGRPTPDPTALVFQGRKGAPLSVPSGRRGLRGVSW